MKARQRDDGKWEWVDSSGDVVASGFTSETQARWWDDRRKDGAVENEDRKRREGRRGRLKSRHR